jgi:hypothetical protein
MSVSEMTQEEKNALGSMQLKNLELVDQPSGPYDAVKKSYVDEQVQSAITLAQTAVTNLINGAGPAMDTLKELSEALLNNPNLGSVLTTQITAVQSALDLEIANRVIEDGKQNVADAERNAVVDGRRLQDQAEYRLLSSDEVTARSIAVQSVSDSVVSEKALRDGYRVADSVEYHGLVSSERSDRESAVASLSESTSSSLNFLTSALSDESSARSLQDEALTIHIDSEQKSREDEKVVYTAKFASEKVDRLAEQKVEKDSRDVLQTLTDAVLSAESVSRSSADSVLEGKVSQEVSDRQDAIASLAQSKLDVSPYYSGGSEQAFKIAEESFLEVGDFWRLRALNSGTQKRLVFEHRVALDAPYKTAIPFIRNA